MESDTDDSAENARTKRQTQLVFALAVFVSFWIGTLLAAVCADQRAFEYAVRDGIIVGAIFTAILSLLFANHEIKAPHIVALAVMLLVYMPIYWIFWIALIGV